jgi:hypothetical protein
MKMYLKAGATVQGRDNDNGRIETKRTQLMIKNVRRGDSPVDIPKI